MRLEASRKTFIGAQPPTASSGGPSLLSTKLAVPLVRPDAVVRDRLISQLDRGKPHRLTLLAAPAGFGKTTLLANWVSGARTPVGWVTLDSGDDDLIRFWTYCVAALQQAFPGVGAGASAFLQLPQPPPIEGMLIALMNEMTHAGSDGILILDDFHLVSSPAVMKSVVFFIDNLPPCLQLVVATRADPIMPLARLRTRDQLVEIRAADLRFTSDEVATFFSRSIGPILSTSDVTALESRTEGWIAGLQLAALSLRGRDDVSGFIQAFTGSHRYVVDYLAQEVLARLPTPLQTFLLETSILDRLTGSLAEAVTGQPDGDRTLEQLERANLFLVPLDDERRWFRYHQLFADVLRHRMRRAHPNQVPTLHRNASIWFEEQGFIREAIKHALASEDLDRYVALVDQVATSLLGRGEIITVRSWLTRVPAEMIRSHRRLAVVQGWLLYFEGQFDAAEELLDHVDSQVAEAGSAENETRGAITTIRAFIALTRGDVVNAGRFAMLALEQLPRNNALRGIISLNVGWTHWMAGDVDAAVRAMVESVDLSRSSGNLYGMFIAMAELAQLRVVQGKLNDAERVCQEGLRLVAEYRGPIPASGLAYVVLGNLHRERNDLDSAERYLREGVKLCEGLGNAAATLEGLVALALLMQTRNDGARALAACDDMRRLIEQSKVPEPVADTCDALRARILLRQGRVGEALRWERETSGRDIAKHPSDVVRITVARVLLAEHRYDQALGLLEAIQTDAETAGQWGSVIEATILASLALDAQDNAIAVEVLARALSLAEPEGYVRLFVDEGAPLRSLLAKVRIELLDGRFTNEAKPSVDYVDRLLCALLPDVDGSAPALVDPRVPTRSIADAGPVAEYLSDREFEVLRLIAEGCSNRDIAERLVIAVSTVKWYVNNIYAKLGVDSRTKAIARARATALLPR